MQKTFTLHYAVKKERIGAKEVAASTNATSAKPCLNLTPSSSHDPKKDDQTPPSLIENALTFFHFHFPRNKIVVVDFCRND